MDYSAFYRESIDSPDTFWGREAQAIDWHRSYDCVLSVERVESPQWFPGGKLNLCHNAVDRHLKDRANQPALVWFSTEVHQERIYSFAELHQEVQAMAAVLAAQGVTAGDRVLIYMPMIPEAAFAMLACARLGAIHSVVFGGFASSSLATRIEDSTPTVIVTADAGSRDGRTIAYKPLVDQAIDLSAHKPRRVLIVDRGITHAAMTEGRDVDYEAAAIRRRFAPHAVRLGRCGSPVLHPVHERHDRSAERSAARHRGVRRRLGRQHEAHLPR